MNEDLETECVKKEEKINILNKHLKEKENEFVSLQMFVKERNDEINQLRENNYSLANQVGGNLHLENKVQVQHNLIQELRNNVGNQVEISCEEIQTLKQEIKQLENINNEKEEKLEGINAEKLKLLEKLKLIELGKVDAKKNGTVKQLDFLEREQGKEKSTTSFTCETCMLRSTANTILEKHKRTHHEHLNEKKLLKANQKVLEMQICQQKLELTSKLFALKQKEVINNQMCKCRGNCLIKHSKFNWNKSPCEDIHAKLKECSTQIKTLTGTKPKGYPCKECDERYVELQELRKHMNIRHKTPVTIATLP